MGPSNRRNTILAGAFVVGSILLAVWASFLLSDTTSAGKMRAIDIRFPIAVGTHGLQKGSPVLMGGQQIGSVRGVRFEFAKDDKGRSLAKAVIIDTAIDNDISIYENAKVYLERPLLGTLSSLNIVGVGDPSKLTTFAGAGPELDTGEMLDGALAPPALLAQAGYGEEQAAQVRTLIKDLSDMVAKAKPNVETGTKDAREVLALLREKVGDWTQKVDTTLSNAEDASKEIRPLLDGAKTGIADFSAAAAGAKQATDDIRAAINDNRPKFDSIMANIDEASSRINRETVDKVNLAINDASEALDSLTSAVDGVQRLITNETPTARRILANIRLMSDQLKLTAVEVRSQPWRLLYQPTRKESQEQILYDSVRSYAEASSDLRSASESLKATTANRAGTMPQDVDRATQAVAASLERYGQAERAFLDLLLASERGPGATSSRPATKSGGGAAGAKVAPTKDED